jgi:autotransporter-associated beta strand protein
MSSRRRRRSLFPLAGSRSWRFLSAARCRLVSVVVLALTLVGVAPAGESVWLNAGSDWGAAGNWSDGVPTDVARFDKSDAKVDPDFNGRFFTINTLRVNSAGAGVYDFLAGGGGGLTLLGGTGYEVEDASGQMLFLGGLRLGMSDPATRQIWRNATGNRILLHGVIGGTGTVHVTNSIGEYRYFATAEPTLVGGVVIDTEGRSDGRGGMFGWILQTNATCSVAFGRTATGAGSLIELSTQTWPRSLNIPGDIQACFRMVPISSGAGDFDVTLENDFRIADQGASISTCQYRLNSVAGWPNLIFGGRLYLAGPLCYRDDIDINPIPDISWGGATHRLFREGVEIDQSAPRRALFRYCRGSRDVRLEGPVVDGAGSFGNPLILQASAREIYLPARSTHACGTVIESTGHVPGALERYVRVQSGGMLGTGPVTITPGGMLLLEGPEGVSPETAIDVQSSALAAGVLAIAFSDDSLAGLVSPASSGVLGLKGNSGAEFNALLAAGPGNGRMFLGAGRESGTFTGASLAAGPDGVYRLGGGCQTYRGQVLTLDVPGSTAGVLAGDSDVQVGAARINGYGVVRLHDVNTYAGTTTITAPLGSPMTTWLYARTSAEGSPLGSAAGALKLEGGSLCLLDGGTAVPPVAKGVTTFTSMNEIRVESSSRRSTLQLGSLERVNGGMLSLRSHNNRFQGNERITVQTPPAVSPAGMTAPYLLAAGQDNNTGFATYDASSDEEGVKGFAVAPTVDLPPAPGTGTEIAAIAASMSLDDVRNIWALRATASVDGNGALGILSGGLVLEGDGRVTISPAVDFGGSEAIVYVARNDATLSGVVTATNGLTKGGDRKLVLSNSGNIIEGPVVVNQGTLAGSWDENDTTPGSLGALANRIVLNGGVLSCEGDNNRVTLAAGRTITLGPLGGRLARGGANNNIVAPLRARFTGPGALVVEFFFNNTCAQIENAANDYAGGTIFAGNENSFVAADAKLGTGPVMVCAGDGYRKVYFHGTENLRGPGGVYLPLQAASGALVNFSAHSAVMGSLSGAGTVILGTAGQAGGNDWPCELTVGLDDGDAAFHGLIAEAARKDWWGDYRALGSLVKDGAGTFALHGRHEYRGTTTVRGGVLRLMGHVAGDLAVEAGGTLSGSGVVGGDLALAGTLAAELTDGVARPLTVEGAVTLGGTLTVARSGAPLAVGQSTVLLNASSVSGAFATVPEGLRVTNDGQTVVLDRVAGGMRLIVR